MKILSYVKYAFVFLALSSLTVSCSKDTKGNWWDPDEPENPEDALSGRQPSYRTADRQFAEYPAGL